MGDAGEGLVDAEARIQERVEERERERAERRAAAVIDVEAIRQRESLRLVRADVVRQLNASTHEHRRNVLTEALADLDRQISEDLSRFEPVAKKRTTLGA